MLFDFDHVDSDKKVLFDFDHVDSDKKGKLM